MPALRLRLAIAAAVIGVALLAVGLRRHRAAHQAAPPEPPRGVVRIESDPPGATALLDGRRAGTTPVELKVPPGIHQLELRLQGYTISHQVLHGSEEELVLVRLRPITPTLPP